jgi:hypothetical protein
MGVKEPADEISVGRTRAMATEVGISHTKLVVRFGATLFKRER